MKILITLEDVRIGGAQTFALRLAQALHLAGHEVVLYSHYAHLVNLELVRQLAPGVALVSYGAEEPVRDWLLRKADGLARRLARRAEAHEQQVVNHLRKYIQRFRPDVVNSHTIKADYVASEALGGTGVPLVITMHGCYELFLHKADAPEVTPKGNRALERARALVYLTEKNLEVFGEANVRPLGSLLHRQIYNGFDAQFSADKSRYGRAALGIPADATVFGMVARGIPEKGWQHAINSFLALEAAYPALQLVLVGASDYLTGLRAQYSHPRLHFTGFAANPVDWVDAFDVGLLPSYFHAESLPNSVAEYLACGKPAIASRIGEVPVMLDSAEGVAGVVLEQAHGQLSDPAQLTEAMRAYLDQSGLLAEHQRRAPFAFEKFRMKYCRGAYENIFQQALAEAQPV